MTKSERRKLILEQAWLGDAVLALYARQHILALDRGIDHELSVRMSSNKFLMALGEPSEVEAQIGRVYSAEGLAAAFQHIESTILPLFNKQLENRRKTQERRVSPPPKSSKPV
jgi:hypothetical protein